MYRTRFTMTKQFFVRYFFVLSSGLQKGHLFVLAFSSKAVRSLSSWDENCDELSEKRTTRRWKANTELELNREGEKKRRKEMEEPIDMMFVSSVGWGEEQCN